MDHPPLAYELYGLRIRSALPLPARARRADGADLDIVWHDRRIAGPERAGRVLAEVSLAGGQGYTHLAADWGYVLCYHGVCEVLVSADLRRLEVQLAPGGDPALVPILLAGNSLAFILALAGEWVLHASAVRIDGRALAFAGGSGRGKSTLAALCCAGGASLVTDDVLRLEQRRTGLRCFPGGDEIRLRPGAGGGLAVRSGAARVEATADGRTALRYDAGDPAMPPLHAVVLPVPARGRATLSVRRLEPRHALVALLACPRVSGLLAPELLAHQFQALARLASTVPMYEALVPWGPPFDPGLPAALAREVGV